MRARASRTRRPAPSRVNPRGSSSNASGLPARLRDDPVAHPLVQHEPHRRAQQRARVAVAQAVHLQLGQVLKLLARLARGEHDPDRLGQQAPGHEGQRQRRGVIQPLRVIDDAQQRTLLGHLREQAQHRQPDEEPIRGAHRRSARTRSRAPGAADPEAARADRASARTADAGSAKASSISDSTPTARTTVRSDADSTRYSSSAVFPIPASPRRTSDRLSPWRIASTNSSSSGALRRPARAGSCSPPGPARRFVPPTLPTRARLPGPGSAGRRAGPCAS